MTAPSSARTETPPVTVVTQTRVKPGKSEDFAGWQRRISEKVAAQPGFVKETIISPSPPAQLDWVILQRFASSEAAVAWLHSSERQRLVAEAQPFLVGQDDVHLVTGEHGGVLPAPISAVISTRIKPGQEQAYQAWCRKIAAAQARFPGFQGYRLEPPVPGVQEDWLTILRFDSEPNLKTWLDSPERKKLLDEAQDFTDEFHVRVVRTGFDQWFEFAGSGAAPPAAWKQDMMVLLVLYPLVYLLTAWLQQPLLVGILHLPYWLYLFINNAVGVVLLSLILPRVSRRFGWWLNPADRNRKRELAGIAVVVALYAFWLLLFWRFQDIIGPHL